MSDILIAMFLGIVEGATEFIPVSSTGHLIVVGHLLNFEGERAATFEVVIQLGAILAIAVLYRDRLLSMATMREGVGMRGRHGLKLLLITSGPALALGAITHSVITDHLFSPLTVAIGWAVGGIGLLLIERFRPNERITSLESIGARQALLVGLCQCLALWPGFSRAASTIGGGMLLGIDRKTAAEYSFLAALPVITAATLLELFTSFDELSRSDAPMFIVGFIVSFAAAWFAVRFFLRLLSTATLRPYGWYRIAAAGVVLILIGFGWIG